MMALCAPAGLVSAAAPVANNVTAAVIKNSTTNPIALNITGGTPTSVAVSTQATHGTATASGTSITYSPAANYSGSDSFQYTASNSSGTSSPATVSVTVGSSAPVSYTYDDQGRLGSATYPDGTVISYTYDLVGNRTQTGPPGGGSGGNTCVVSLNTSQGITTATGTQMTETTIDGLTIAGLLWVGAQGSTGALTLIVYGDDTASTHSAVINGVSLGSSSPGQYNSGATTYQWSGIANPFGYTNGATVGCQIN
jgi:YD repeat-containing protein